MHYASENEGGRCQIKSAGNKTCLPKSPWLSRVADTYRFRYFRGVGHASCHKRAGSGPHQLQPCKDGDHGDSGLQFVRRNLPCQQAPEPDSDLHPAPGRFRHPANKEGRLREEPAFFEG